jgi:hypothetical protein
VNHENRVIHHLGKPLPIWFPRQDILSIGLLLGIVGTNLASLSSTPSPSPKTSASRVSRHSAPDAPPTSMPGGVHSFWMRLSWHAGHQAPGSRQDAHGQASLRRSSYFRRGCKPSQLARQSLRRTPAGPRHASTSDHHCLCCRQCSRRAEPDDRSAGTGRSFE